MVCVRWLSDKYVFKSKWKSPIKNGMALGAHKTEMKTIEVGANSSVATVGVMVDCINRVSHPFLYLRPLSLIFEVFSVKSWNIFLLTFEFDPIICFV